MRLSDRPPQRHFLPNPRRDAMTATATLARRSARLPAAAAVCLYAALVLAPLALAAAAANREESFPRELSLAVGMVAFAMLALQFVLSGRFECLSGAAGIDLTMRFHQLLARTLAALVLLHPVLLVAPVAWRDPTAALGGLARMFLNPQLGSAVAAFTVVLALVAAGLWRRRLPIRYELWRLSHGVGAVMAIGFTAHQVAQHGVYAEAPGPRLFWAALVALAIGSFTYIYAINPVLLWRRRYLVERVDRAGDGIWEIVLRPAHGGALAFSAGQFAWVSFGRFPVPGRDNPFSIASAPEDGPTVRFLVKEAGDLTRAIGTLAPGTPAYLDAPHGNFTLDRRDGASLCLVAGGIGIAPILSLLRHLDRTGDRRPVALVWAAHREGELVHRDEIEDLVGRLDLTVSYVLEEPPAGWGGARGRPDRAVLARALRGADPGACLAFVCGPTPMMRAAAADLTALGLPPRRIVYEQFAYD